MASSSHQKHDDHDDHSHSHSHSIFHSHAHGENGHADESRKMVEVLKNKGNPGSRITLLGLFVNVGLTASKGLAGWTLHSASLMADAGHSLSDLLGDFVTLFCWNLSRRPPSEKYPYGFGKFETLGTTSVSLMLIGGALGIGFHSYYLLLDALLPTISTLQPGALQTVLTWLTSARIAPDLLHSHAHALDPNAAWFALISIVVKEWLYRITKRVADQENSSVLLANAIHHRSDAYSSFVALVAILGTWAIPSLPLDPIGGLVVSVVILNQGIAIMKSALGELTDAGVSKKTLSSLSKSLDSLIAVSTSEKSTLSVVAIENLRAKRAGALMFVDLTAKVSPHLTVDQSTLLEDNIRERLRTVRTDISEVRVRFVPGDEKTDS
ncbi:mitochondrial iron ion transporter [Sistotremastrum suecicum HHB10207 ss-3]|uniref:Mitochondrial iron ion transporter n=1 Tax=Sistotremastrum suecicum HHB10207 ss-3 TaxID=1314776 RepID=A0A166I797_9AGAM|nr:mitochondrial iron ion transporter [Sistotremastrum suecicum HHB10207 ss-3]